MPVDNALIHADSAPLLCAESEPQAPRKRAESEPSIMLNRHPPKPVVLAFSTFPFLITHDPQPASRADMASEGLPRLHAPIQPTCS